MKRKKTKKLPAVRDTQNDAVRLRAFQHISNHKKRRFLIAYVEAGTLRGEALLAGGAKGLWRSHYNWLDADKEYAESFERAKAMIADYAEDCVYERAFQGYDRQLTYKGRKT